MGSDVPAYNLKVRRSSTDAPAIGGGRKVSMEDQLMKVIGIKLLTDSISSQSKSKERGNIGEEIKNVERSLGRPFNPGEKISMGDTTITPNPELNESQSKAVAGMSVYPKAKNQIIDLIKGGILSSQKGLLGMGKGVLPGWDRGVRQTLVEQDSPWATSFDDKLQNLQSKAKKLKQLMFDISGATLTDNEEAVLGNAFKFAGKSDEQIIKDIEDADDLVEAKAKLALGGMNAGREMMGQSQQQQFPEDEDEIFNRLRNSV